MNQMQLLRDADPAAGPVPTAGRESLLAAVREHSPVLELSVHPARLSSPVHPPRRPHGTLARVLTVAAAVLALVVGGLTWQVVGAGRAGGASPAAAAVLEQAAAAAVGARDVVPKPGQYLLVTTRAVDATSAMSAGQKPLTWLTRSSTQVWIPGDRSREWVQRRTGSTPYRFFSEAARARARAMGLLHPAGAAELLRAHDDAFYGPVTGSWQTPTPTFLATLPRDPHQLLARIYRDSKGQGPSRDGEALVYVADLLRCGFVPAALRAALFRAATDIPGVKVIDRRANLDGRVGVAVGRDEGATQRQEIIFDPGTGQVIGERQVNLHDKGSGIPPGQVTGYTAVTATVVNNAP